MGIPREDFHMTGSFSCLSKDEETYCRFIKPRKALKAVGTAHTKHKGPREDYKLPGVVGTVVLKPGRALEAVQKL